MIRHIVMWSLKNEHKGQKKAQLASALKQQLLHLETEIPQIKTIRVGINEADFERNHDVVLDTEFESYDDLQLYVKHPAHVKLVSFVREISTGRAAIDFTRD